jgi:hypothetical protein
VSGERFAQLRSSEDDHIFESADRSGSKFYRVLEDTHFPAKEKKQSVMNTAPNSMLYNSLEEKKC